GAEKRFDILLRHLSRVSELAEKYGFKPMMWSDMFFRIAGNGEYYHTKPIPEEVTEKVPQNVQLVYWDYYNEDETLLECMTKHHLDFHRKVWIAGGAWKWCGFQSDNKKSLSQTEKFIRSAKKQGVNDILITLWGDNGGECSPYAVLPSLVYAAECARGNFDVENAKEKFKEIFGESWDDFMLCDLPCPEPLAKTGYRLGVKEMLYSDYFLSSFDCGVLGTGEERKIYAEFADRFSGAEKRSKHYGYLFASYAALCRALSVKYDLGYRTREAYGSGDKNALAALIPEYEKTLALLEEFAQTYEKQWLKENKPHGFDVQDIRLGGIIQRTKSCMRRLKAYVGGEISKIDELEEETVDFSTGEAPKRNGASYNCYRVIASANVI
ncbi:MAG: hypothetical protein SPH68_03355, partial [Candidatus Borkfalkiaceae bacterium]|nr:hypothetical protein [Clostridia bacterium]MDY6223182.1 hypothetical protein [Christensenellaceae bacterium]